MEASVLIIIVLIILTIANICYLVFFWIRSKEGRKIKEKENYYKLDAKIELHKFMAIAVISVAAFFGYSKFSDLSNDFTEMDKKVEKFEKVIEDYDSLQIVIKQLKIDLELVREEKEMIESEFEKQNQKIKEATTRIPEANIRILTKQLVFTNMRNAGLSSLAFDKPDDSKIKIELKKSQEILRNAGFSQNEIDQIFIELKQEYSWINNN